MNEKCNWYGQHVMGCPKADPCLNSNTYYSSNTSETETDLEIAELQEKIAELESEIETLEYNIDCIEIAHAEEIAGESW